MADMHATLSASSSHRWLACPPSALLNAAAPDTRSEYAAQGTDAHTLCEYKVLKAIVSRQRIPRRIWIGLMRKWRTARMRMRSLYRS